MNKKQIWREQIRKTKIALKKRHLTKKERLEIQEGMMKMGVFEEKPKENWKSKSEPTKIGDIL